MRHNYVLASEFDGQVWERDANPVEWYVAQLKPNAAQLAVRNLERQGFSALLPLEQFTRRQGGQIISATRPYFPGYVFVGCALKSSPWRAINSTTGVARTVSFGKVPAEIPLELIMELQSHCDEHGVLRVREAVRPGQKIRIANGPFSEMLGEIDRLAPQERAWALIDVLGKKTRVCVSQDDFRVQTS